ncbi:hypothetical protein HZS55_05045 [Halosimplex rubrum]|uniref:Uncharacterized protein n=1 Tax=Halosimplex rubrum TaxID=869889 RepID=A0A7D5T499_9EURY|nr:hypothetical protein [Halosimplex rubrum]QLH76709.1 hypothetical protein HZS55_05045 [Halosimplex rubrum]
MTLTRRSVLRAIGAAVPLAVAGCETPDSPEPDADAAPSPAPTDTPRVSRTPGTASRTTASPSSTPDRDAEDVLPEPGSGWTLTETRTMAARMLGAETGVVGEYERPDGTRFRAVVLKRFPRHDPTRKAERWACIGWDVAVADEDFAFAAGTGTEQRDYTPETPPYMDRTAIPGSADRSRDLLARSPLLSAERIDANEVTCES